MGLVIIMIRTFFSIIKWLTIFDCFVKGISDLNSIIRALYYES